MHAGAAGQDSAVAATYGELLGNRRYLAFWLGQVTSVAGSAISLVALPALVLPSRGPAVFGLVVASEALAGVLLLLFGGVIADRYSRSAVMAVSDVISACGVAGFILLAEAGPLPALMLAACLVGVGGALYQPAHRATMPQVVPVELLQKANALDSATKRLGAAGGALLGALLIVSVGAKGAFAIDIVTFVVSLVTLLWLRLPAIGGTPSGAGVRAVLAEAREGISEVRRRPWALVIMIQGTVQVFLPLRSELRAGADREPAAVGPGGVWVAQLVGVHRHDARLGAGRADHNHETWAVGDERGRALLAAGAVPMAAGVAASLVSRRGRRVGRHRRVLRAVVHRAADPIPARGAGPGLLAGVDRQLRLTTSGHRLSAANHQLDRARPLRRRGGRHPAGLDLRRVSRARRRVAELPRTCHQCHVA